MKNYFVSIRKSINHFPHMDEELAAKSLDLHDDQFIAQEESWTPRDCQTAIELWNRFIELVGSKFPNLVEGE